MLQLQLEGAEAVTRLAAQRNGLKYVMKVSKKIKIKCFSLMPPLPLMNLKYLLLSTWALLGGLLSQVVTGGGKKAYGNKHLKCYV